MPPTPSTDSGAKRSASAGGISGPGAPRGPSADAGAGVAAAVSPKSVLSDAGGGGTVGPSLGSTRPLSHGGRDAVYGRRVLRALLSELHVRHAIQRRDLPSQRAQPRQLLQELLARLALP